VRGAKGAQTTPDPPFWNLIITPRPLSPDAAIFFILGFGKKSFGLFFWAASLMPIVPLRRHWMWANGHIRRAAHGYEPRREGRNGGVRQELAERS